MILRIILFLVVMWLMKGIYVDLVNSADRLLAISHDIIRIAPKLKADYAFVQQMLLSIDEIGTMSVVLPQGLQHLQDVLHTLFLELTKKARPYFTFSEIHDTYKVYKVHLEGFSSLKLGRHNGMEWNQYKNTC